MTGDAGPPRHWSSLHDDAVSVHRRGSRAEIRGQGYGRIGDDTDIVGKTGAGAALTLAGPLHADAVVRDRVRTA